MYKKMLVPLDGSEFSARILEHAKAIAAGCKIPEVILLKVESRRADDIFMSSRIYHEGRDWASYSVKNIKAAAMKYLSQIAADLKQEGISAKPVVIWGNPAEEIVDYIKNNQVDLVVMSTHGRSGVTRFLLGSVAHRVVRHSVAPVLVATPFAHRLKEG
jgi:nucleotide-binding universal stress UspA family protein